MATAKETIMQIFDKVDVPPNLTERQITIAKSFAMNKITDRLPIKEWAESNKLSPKTTYDWNEKVQGYKSYVDKLIDSSVDDSVKEALFEMDRHVMKLAYKTNVTPAEIAIFEKYFGYALEARKRQYLKDHGLDESGNKIQISHEERRNKLLQRLQGGNK